MLAFFQTVISDDDGFEIIDDTKDNEQCTSCGTPQSRTDHSDQTSKKKQPNQDEILKYVKELQEQKELEGMQDELHSQLPDLDEFDDTAFNSIQDFVSDPSTLPLNTFGMFHGFLCLLNINDIMNRMWNS